MKETDRKVLAMYDAKGIQEYIYRTDKVKDVIGASYIVENIILEALKNAVERAGAGGENKCQIEWCDTEDRKSVV